MNLILLNEADLRPDNRVSLTDRRHQHISSVIKPKPGDRLRTGLLGGKIGLAEVIECSSSRTTLAIQNFDRKPPKPLDAQLFIGLPRPKNIARMLQALTTMGIKQIHFFHCYQVEKSFWQSDLLNQERLKLQMILGLEQAVDTILPELHFHRYFRPFVEDHLPKLATSKTQIVLHPYSEASLKSADLNNSCDFVIGPEGGLIEYEVELLKAAGFKAYTLGNRIYKTEQALSMIPSLLTWTQL